MNKRASVNFRKGFTMIETMLFLALTGLIFVGVVAGTSGGIRTQRYKDAVQTFADDLRTIISEAENIEVLQRGDQAIYCSKLKNESGAFESKNLEVVTKGKTGRGRSQCVQYGKIAIIHMGRDSYVESYGLVGSDSKNEVKDNDLETLRYHAFSNYYNTDLDHLNKRVYVNQRKKNTLWASQLSVVCPTSSEERKKFILSVPEDSKDTCSGTEKFATGYVVILASFRSPSTGEMRNAITVTNLKDYSNVNPATEIIKEQNKPKTIDEVSVCIKAGEGQSDSMGQRMIKISAGLSGDDSIRIIEADSEENKCNS